MHKDFREDIPRVFHDVPSYFLRLRSSMTLAFHGNEKAARIVARRTIARIGVGGGR